LPPVWTKLEDWADDAGPAKRRLREANIHLFADDMKKAIDKARQSRSYPPLPLIERPGWAGPHFALPSGEVFCPPGAEPAIVLFDKETERCGTKGNKEWLDGVARLTAGQSIITFALMIAFAAPILILSAIMFNPGFELAGPRRKGKSTLQQLVASILGSAVAANGRNYWIDANSTVNSLEDCVPKHNDLPIIIEEMGLYYAGESQKNRALKVRELVMRLSNGTVKARRGEKQPPSARFTYLTSSNEPLSALFGEQASQTSLAAGDRLLTILVAARRKYGIFDRLPKDSASSADAILEVTRLIEDHYGGPIRVFLRRLVRERAANEAKLKTRIQADVDRFRDAVGVDRNVGSEASIADVFGLIYAAGRLARRYKALPKQLKCLPAAMKVYRLNRALGVPAPSNVERLRRLAHRKGVIRADATELQEIPDSLLKKAPAILLKHRSGQLELLLTSKALKRAFPRPNLLFRDPDIADILVADGDGRRGTKRTFRSNARQERVYCFLLNLGENDN